MSNKKFSVVVLDTNYYINLCSSFSVAVAWYACVCGRKQFHPSRNSANAYIVFASEVAAEKALELYVSLW